MRKTLFATAAVAALAAVPMTAQAASNNTLVGVGVGAGTGAVVAGPVGAVVGGVAGGVVGSNYDRPRRVSRDRYCWRDNAGIRHCQYR